MKKFKFEDKYVMFIKKNIDFFLILIITMISLFIRFNLFSYKSSDYDLFLSKWFLFLKEHGGLKALKYTIGDYNQIYLTILAILTYLPVKSLYSIKIVSVIFDYLLAFFSMFFIKKNTKSEKLGIISYILIIMSPLVILNGSYWGQCDVIYTFFLLVSLYYLLREKYIKSLIFLGISLAFKLQAIFLLPVYIIVYFNKKDFSIINFLLVPLTILGMSLPSIIFGHSVWDCFKVYFTQISEFPFMSLNVLNFWSLFPNDFDYLRYIAYGIVLVVFALLLFYVIKRNKELGNNDILNLSLISILVCVCFLPCMHERYLFVGDVLSILWYLLNRKKIYVPIVINLISFFSYMKFLYSFSTVLDYFLPFLFLFIIVDLIICFVREYSKNY